jgi:hypothetical protein
VTPYGQLARASAEAVLFEVDGIPREAADRFAQVVGGWRDLGVVPELAHALAGLGRCLIALGELEDGTSQLRDARIIWESLAADVRTAEVDVWLTPAGTGLEPC